MIPNLKVEVLEPALCKGVPSETDFKALDVLAGTIAQKHKEHDREIGRGTVGDGRLISAEAIGLGRA
jgi:hypothetical protein